jgi:hypothetical protein
MRKGVNGTDPNGYLSFPIFGSIDNCSVFGFDNQDDRFLVLPGYKLVSYDGANYASTVRTYDNTVGSTQGGNRVVLFSAGTNTTSSMKLYYGNTEIIAFKQTVQAPT